MKIMKKVAVIGAGNVGAQIINYGITQNLPVEFLLLDINQELEAAQVLDLKDTLLFSPHSKIQGIDFDSDILEDIDIIVITAGASQSPGETRCDLLGKNAKILHSISQNIKNIKSSCIILVVSNPVDVLTKLCHDFFDLPAKQIFGTGTLLDTSRLRWKLCDHFGLREEEVDGYVLGEHGDSEFVAWSTFKKSDDLSMDEKNKIEEKVRKAAYEIIEGKGSTFFGIAAVTNHIIKAILRDSGEIIPASILLTGEYGIDNICISVPVRIGEKGYEKISLDLSEEEIKKLNASAEKMSGLYQSCPLKH